MASIHERHEIDKVKTLEAVTSYLLNNENSSSSSSSSSSPNPPTLPSDVLLRTEINTNVHDGDYQKALRNLETLRDAKTGISHHFVGNVLIRDARLALDPPVRESEGFEMNYLNVVRGAMDIIEGEGNYNLMDELTGKVAHDFINFQDPSFYVKGGKKKVDIPKEAAKVMKANLKSVGELMEQRGGGSDVYSKLNVAKDFQNLNDEHFNIATISLVNNSIVAEIEVAMKGLSHSQRLQYESILNDDVRPAWYLSLPEWERELCQKYVSAILQGHHVLPTQLRQCVGMKNAFEKMTCLWVGEKNGGLKVLHSSKHAGTLASLSRDKESRQGITDDNCRQAQEWLGGDLVLHCNTLNSGPIGAGDDPEIVRLTQESMKNVNGKITNSAFNAFRKLKRANDYSGVKDTLDKINVVMDQMSQALGCKINGRKSKTSEEIDLMPIDEGLKHVFKYAVRLKKELSYADVRLRMIGDQNNWSLRLATTLGLLSHAMKKQRTRRKEEPSAGKTQTMFNEEVLIMCASGKDRTGLAMHDQSAHVIANTLGIELTDVDRRLLLGGHTAQQAGGLYAGGATIGCFGTKDETRASLPMDRHLEGIIELTANYNKVKAR